MVYIWLGLQFKSARFGWAKTSGVAVVQCAQEHLLEVDLVDAFGLARQRDGLAHERFANGTQPALPLDLAVVPDVTHGPTAPIAEGLWPAITSAAAVIAFGGVTSGQRFMGPLGVVVTSPAITAPLLGGRMGRRWPGRVPFECLVANLGHRRRVHPPGPSGGKRRA